MAEVPTSQTVTTAVCLAQVVLLQPSSQKQPGNAKRCAPITRRGIAIRAKTVNTVTTPPSSGELKMTRMVENEKAKALEREKRSLYASGSKRMVLASGAKTVKCLMT